MTMRLTGMLAGLSLALVWGGIALAEDRQPVPGLSTKDRVILATTMVHQGQCKNGLAEIREAMKELPDDETLLRLKGTCELEDNPASARETLMKWLKVAPQDHPERAKMLGLLASASAPTENPTEWILIPAGEFTMGADGSADADERPAHKVHLDNYYIGKYEVTNRHYESFVDATNHRVPENCCDPRYNIWRGKDSLPGTDETPVVNVSWDDAVAYCKWAGGRLPTEAEWEKAARGTDGRKFPWGNDPASTNRANFTAESFTFWEGPATLAKKDQYEFGRSPYGAYEMAGNVWEWVQDFYDADYYKNSPPKNPQGPSNGKDRIVRGGSWQNTPEILRTTNRNKHAPEDRRTYIGIRCAKDAPESK